MSQVFPRGAVEVKDEKSSEQFKVNGQSLKRYFEGGWVGHISTISLLGK